MNYKEILALSAEQLIEFLTDNFTVMVPDSIDDINDMKKASELLLRLASNYSYLCALSSYSKIATRCAKRELSKQEYEDMVDKKEIISFITDSVNKQYSAISRAVTIHIENNNELKMNLG